MPGATQPIIFDCAGSQLVGIVHRPAASFRRGVLIVVGGPQYRVGSHRQFVLLARDLAAAGFAVMRFDHRGIGDSDGPAQDFEHLDDDIEAALAGFRSVCPELQDIVIWGLCDAASAALFYSRRTDLAERQNVSGLVLLNPWIRTEQGEAQAYLNKYYGRRILQGAFWKKLLTGQVAVLASLRSFLRNILTALTSPPDATNATAPLPERMLQAFTAFDSPVLLILSGNDLTAAEFEAQAASDNWQAALQRSTVHCDHLPDSDHTFSRRAWRDRVAGITIDWLQSW